MKIDEEELLVSSLYAVGGLVFLGVVWAWGLAGVGAITLAAAAAALIGGAVKMIRDEGWQKFIPVALSCIGALCVFAAFLMLVAEMVGALTL